MITRNLLLCYVVVAQLLGVFSYVDFILKSDDVANFAVQQARMPVGTVYPISQNVYFGSQVSYGGFDLSSCTDSRRSLTELDVKSTTNFGNPLFGINPVKGMSAFYGYTNTTTIPGVLTNNNEISVAHQIEMKIKDRVIIGNFSSINPCFATGTCEQEYHNSINLPETKTITEQVKRHNIDNEGRVLGQTCDLACGKLTTVTDFAAKVGDTVYMETNLNGTNQLILGRNIIQSITLKDLEIIYPLVNGWKYGVDIDITTKCECHCPWGINTIDCNSNYNGCSDEKVCVNTYMGGQNDWSCPLNIGYDSSYCCSISAVPEWTIDGFEIGTATDVFALFEVCILADNPFFNNPAGGCYSQFPVPNPTQPECWTKRCYELYVGFGTTDLAFAFNDTQTNFQYTCVLPFFQGWMEILEVGDLLSYAGGDLILNDTSNYYGEPLVATGWNTGYETDVTKPGWLTISGSTYKYNSNGLLSNTKVDVSNCRDDEFVITQTISKSSVTDLPALSELLAGFGTYDIDWTNMQLSLKPTKANSAIFRYTSNVPGVVSIHTGQLTSFNCSRIAPNTAIVLECSLTNYIGGSICFTIYGSGGAPLGVSCGAPNLIRESTSVVQLSYSLGSITIGGQICANGFSTVQCVYVNITTNTFNSYDPDWIGKGVNFKSKDKKPEVSFNFGNIGTWGESATSVIYTILIFLSILFGCCFCVGLIIVFVIYGAPLVQKIKDLKRKAKLNALLREKEDESLIELSEAKSEFVNDHENVKKVSKLKNIGNRFISFGFDNDDL